MSPLRSGLFLLCLFWSLIQDAYLNCSCLGLLRAGPATPHPDIFKHKGDFVNRYSTINSLRNKWQRQQFYFTFIVCPEAQKIKVNKNWLVYIGNLLENSFQSNLNRNLSINFGFSPSRLRWQKSSKSTQSREKNITSKTHQIDCLMDVFTSISLCWVLWKHWQVSMC